MSGSTPVWDDPVTVEAYAQFLARHDRYARANEALVTHAGLDAASRVLDVGAGLGSTAERAFLRLGPEAHVVCVETATAMRERGAARVTDPRVTWLAALPRRGPFDCILSGAAIWLMLPLEDTLARWRALLAPGGCLAFDIPAAYLGQTDDPGGGNDPHLLGLVQALAEKALGLPAEPAASLPSPEAISVLLEGLGFTVTRWTHSARLTQAAYRDWLKLPAVNGSLLGRVPVAERAALVDAAWEGVDQTAWRPERWLGWTAVLP